MRKLKTLFTVLFLAVFGLGNVWGEDYELVYTNDCPISTSNSSYANYYDVTINNVSWKAPGNQYADGAWRIGIPKNNKNVTADKYIYTQTAISDKITKINIANSVGANLNVNSMRIDVYSTATLAAAGADGDVYTSSLSYGSSVDVIAPSSANWSGRFYRITYNVTATTTSAGYFLLNSVSFYKTAGSSTETALSSIAISGTPDKTAYKVGDAFDPAGLVVTGTYSEGDPKAITEGITWAVTPETLTEGLTSVTVTATVSGVESEEYVVNGLTVTAPDPSVSFIFNTDAGLSALGITKPATSRGTNLGSAAYTSNGISMTATDGGTETRVWNSNGTTSLRAYANGGSLTFAGATITKIVFTGTVPMTANVGTFSEKTWTGESASVTFTATGSVTISTIEVSYVAGSTKQTVATPVLPDAGAFIGSKEIILSCETEGATIYYTTNGDVPTTSSTQYTSAFTINETTTVKAIAVKADMFNSAVASATYTKVVTLNSMDEIFAAATAAGSTAASKVITFDNWVISGVKNSNAYLTDNNGKGLIIYQSGHGFVVGDILSGTATCNVQLYNGSAELTALTSTTDGLTVTKGGVVTPITSASIADLGGVNTGAIYSFSNLTYNGSEFSDGENTIKPYNTFITLPTLLADKSYNVKGMYLQYNTTKEIAPFEAGDLELITQVTLTSIAISGTVNKNEYYVGDAFDKAGLVVTATYSDASTLDVTSSAEWSFDPAALDNTSITTVNVTATFNEVSSEAYPVAITVSPAPLKVTWDLSKDETATATEDEISWASDYATMNATKGTTAANNYYPGTSGQSYTSTRMYKNSVLTVAPVDGYVIDKVEFAATTTGYAGVLNATWTNASASVNDKLVTVTPTDGEAAMSITLGNTTGFTSVVVYYHVGPTKYNVVENLNGCSADEENAKKFLDGTDELTLKYTLTDGYIWPENITVKVGETTLSAADVDYMWTAEGVNGKLEIAYEMHDNLTVTISAVSKVVTGITVKTAPTKVEYYVGDNFDPAGLVITATYNDASYADIAYADAAADFSFAPALDAELALTDENVVITFNGKTCNQAISVTKAPIEATWVAEEQGYENDTEVTSAVLVAGAVNATFDNGSKYYNTGKAIRVYGGKSFTISAYMGITLTKIILAYGEGDATTNAISTDCGTFETNTWTGEASSVKFTEAGTSGQRRIAGITVYYTGEIAGKVICGSHAYETLAAAIAAEENGTITLLEDLNENVVVPAGKTFTLDLNGHTLNGAQTASTATIKNLGTLTVQNGTVKRAGAGSASYYIIENYGTMTLNCNVEGSASASLIRNNAAEAKMTFVGGEYTQTGNFIVVKNDLGEVIINDGTFTTSAAKNVLNNWDRMTINGGTFNGRILSGAYDIDNTNLTINGGTFNTEAIRSYIDNGQTAGLIEIKGGEFTNASMIYVGKNNTEADANIQIVISGGTFANPVPADYCAEDFQPKDNGNGTYGVQEAIKVTEIVLGGDFKQVFSQNAEFEFDGTVTAKYNHDQDDADVTENASFSGYNMSTTGPQTVTVSYTEEGVTVTTTYDILVMAAAGSLNFEKVDFTEVYSVLSGNDKGDLVADGYQGASLAMTFAKKTGTNNAPLYYANGTAARCYVDNTITIAAIDPILAVDIDWVNNYVDDAVSITGLGTTTAVVTFSKTCRFTAIKVYYKVATIGEVGYTTLADAFAAVPADNTETTIELLTDCAGNGIIVYKDQNVVVNFNNHTYTVNTDVLAGSNGTKNQCFQLLMGATVVFNDGTIVADNAAIKMIIQNYADLTLNNMVLDATVGTNNVKYVLSTNNGETNIVDTEITAKEGEVAFDVCGGWGNYQSNEVTVSGESVIDGKIEISQYNETATESLTIAGGDFTNAEIVVDQANGGDQVVVTKDPEATVVIPDGYKWDENNTLVKDVVSVRIGLTVGKMGTICYGYDLAEVKGATFYKPIAYDGFYLHFEEVDEVKAGYGYMFVAEAEEITAVKLGDVELTNAVTGAPNHMQGILADDNKNLPEGRDYCGIKNGHWQFFGQNNTMTAGHAYIVLEGLPTEEPQGANPGRRHLVVSSADNTAVVTGLDFSDLDTEVATKVLRDGQLYIIREGKMYNVQGAVVK